MTNDSDERPDGMKIFHVAERRWAAFTADGDFIAVLSYDEARPLLFRPAARRLFLAEHTDQAGDQPNGA
jgi:hypothetical protein